LLWADGEEPAKGTDSAKFDFENWSQATDSYLKSIQRKPGIDWALLFEAVAPYVVSSRKARRADAAPVDDEEEVDPRSLL
jgi:hypothetical protein